MKSSVMFLKAATINMQHQHHNHNQQTGTIYTCPMHPEVKPDKPGNCPKCGMNLIEKNRVLITISGQHRRLCV